MRTASRRSIGPRPGTRKPPPRTPKLDALVSELKRAVERMGVQVRHERLMREVGYHAHSGLCRLGDQELLLLDYDLPTDAQLELLLDTLAGRDLSEQALSEEARDLLRRSAVDKARSRS